MNSDSLQLYLLGNHPAGSPPSLRRCQQLMELCQDAGEFLSFDAASECLSCYARDAQMLQSKLPLLVFRPFTLKGIPPFIKNCHALEIPVTVRSGGTGLSGGCISAAGGVVLITSRLKKISHYDREKGTLIIEPGVTVRQLNHFVEGDHWHFPLEMASDGIASLAGCLSTHARGYHQQQCAFYEAVEWVALADGTGEILEVPSSFVCGAEGMWGVILEMKMRLKKKSIQRSEFRFLGTWKDLLAQLPSLQCLQSLTYLIKTQEACYLGLEGEKWRMPIARLFLEENLPGVEAINQFTVPLMPTRKPFAVFSSAFKTSQLPEACAIASEEALRLHLTCHYTADVLAGSLHLSLQAEESDYTFAQKVEQFLTFWADVVDRKEGILGSCHGIGMQMRPFMTPFWGEETRTLWQKLKLTFDQKGIFGREHFFPPSGKSLEKICRSS